MNTTGTSSYWLRLRLNFIVYIKYVDPILLLIFIAGGLLLISVIISRRREIRYPTTTTIAIIWLLLADIGHLVSQMVVDLGFIGVISHVMHRSDFSCYGYAFTTSTLLTMQGYVQAVISIERLLAVTKPLQVKRLITNVRMVGLLLVATAVSACVAIGYVLLGFDYAEHPKKPGVMLCQPQIGVSMAVFILLAWILPPATIMTVCSIGIIKTLVSSARRYRKSKADSAKLSSAQKRLSLMLVAMNVIFVLSAVPMSICYFLITVWHSPKMKFFWNLSVFCTRFGTFSDWIIVLAIGSQLRQSLVNMCRPRREPVTVDSGSTGMTEPENQVLNMKKINSDSS